MKDQYMIAKKQLYERNKPVPDLRFLGISDIFFIYSRQQYEAELGRYMTLLSGKDEI